jgi:hypothetical protein
MHCVSPINCPQFKLTAGQRVGNKDLGITQWSVIKTTATLMKPA